MLSQFLRRTFVCLCLVVPCGAQLAGPNLPVQHVIVVIQENRTPSNLFLEDSNLVKKGAHLPSSGSCYNTQIPFTPVQLDGCFDPAHGHIGAWIPTYDGGKMDGACSISPGLSTGCVLPACPVSKYAHCPEYSYVPNTKYDGVHGILDPYFQMAEQYGFANYMFQTNQGPSFSAHQFLFSGTSAPTAYPETYYDWFASENYTGAENTYGCVAPFASPIREVAPTGKTSLGYTPLNPPGANQGFPCYEHRTLGDVLDEAGTSWRYYSSFQSSLWSAPNAIDHICQPSGLSGNCNGPAYLTGKVTHTQQFLTDLGVNGTGPESCRLQQVSWVTPDGLWSDHSGTAGADGGPSWVAAIVNAVGGYRNDGTKLPVQCGYWANTVVLVTWDDWGGFYDDVDPIKTMGRGLPGYPGTSGNGVAYVYGFRVPLLVVSTFSKPGYISGPQNNPVCPNHYCHDFGSILNFIEYAFGTNGNSLGPIGPKAWPYADAYVQDRARPPNYYSLYDFFQFGEPQRAFIPITGSKYATACFLDPPACFTTPSLAPDSD